MDKIKGTSKTEVATIGIETTDYSTTNIIIDALISNGYDIVRKPTIGNSGIVSKEQVVVYRTNAI